VRKKSKGFYCRYIKRFFDIVLALIIAIPAFLIIAICYLVIKLETRGPAFFVQKRPGMNGKIFALYKLRTMIVETQRDGKPLSDMERMTKIGRIIRACSFDELPQVWNIIKGDMSFIGPRPLLVQYLPLYTEEQMRRHEVRPGISGWAQVNGRNELSWEQKFQRDVWYVDHVGCVLDVKIFWLTVWNVLHRSGINAGVSETMEAFCGCCANTGSTRRQKDTIS
jgi:lipopolysaccharide/colanic/teichoic acid biosynthesis glycosyltransferase